MSKLPALMVTNAQLQAARKQLGAWTSPACLPCVVEHVGCVLQPALICAWHCRLCSFILSSDEILAALASPDLDIEPLADVELPEHLADPLVIEEQCQVCWPPSLPPSLPVVVGVGHCCLWVCECAGLQLDTCGYR